MTGHPTQSAPIDEVLDPINLALAALLAAILSLSCLLDGPDDIETMRNVQADLVDAQTVGVLK